MVFNLLSACLNIYLKYKHDKEKESLYKGCLALPLKPYGCRDDGEAISLAAGCLVLCLGLCERGHQEATDRSMPLALPSLFPQGLPRIPYK